jgi:hypothetical protein
MQLAEGDVIITFNKTLDLIRQVMDMLVDNDPENPLIYAMREARRLVRRGVVEQVNNIGFGILKDTLEGDDETPATTSDGVAPVSSDDDEAIDSVPVLAAPTPLRRPVPVYLGEDEEPANTTEEGVATADGKRRFGNGKRRGKPGRYVNTRRH